MIKAFRTLAKHLAIAAASARIEAARDALAGRVNLGTASEIDWTRVQVRPGASIQIGEWSSLSGVSLCEAEGARIEVGSRVYCAGDIMCAQHIVIEDDVMISSGSSVMDHDSHSVDFEIRKTDVVNYLKGKKDWSSVNRAPVFIRKGAWIGHKVIVLKGVTIGEYAIVGAGSVVTSDVPSRTIVAGNPARVIRRLDA